MRFLSCFYQLFKCYSAETCILFEHKILKQFSDREGRFVIVDIKTEDNTLTLVNVYARNDDNHIPPSLKVCSISFSLSTA